MIGLGAGVGVIAILVDALLGAMKKLRLPPLAIGIGVYLPMAATLPVVIGSVLGLLYERRAARSARPEFAKRMGVLLATGMIVGDSLLNVAFAGLVARWGPEAIALDHFFPGVDMGTVALIAGVLVFAGLVAWLYRSTRRVAATPAAASPASG